ncbi:pyroglutamyl-peptidase I [Meiothermus rufus]|uniref:pyroglutamyl-peptidase I n=1 Tax=Meiothermus rufus TaxID=604332 RepID=UPI0004284467|nr:pyroglutamyl-peptidase I [Meiothermus rufus]
MKVLVTGFEPFAGLAHNPSQALLAHLPPRIRGTEVVSACLPVNAQQAPAALKALYQTHTPRLALHLGLAQNRPLLSLERLAVNLLDFDIPDNGGHHPKDAPILPGGPLALLSRLPLRIIQARWAQAGIPSTLSNSAGLYLCNQVMYLALSWLPPEVPAGFIHLPPDETLAAQRPQAYVPLKTQAQAILLALETCLEALA